MTSWARLQALPEVDLLHYRGPVLGLPASVVPLDYGIAMAEGGYGVTHRGECRQVEHGVHGIHPGETIRFHPGGAEFTRVRAIAVGAAAFRTAAEEHGLLHAHLIVPTGLAGHPDLLLAAEAFWKSSVDDCSLGVESAFFGLLRTVFELTRQAPALGRRSIGSAAVRRAKDCILSCFSGDLTLEQLARESGVTKAYFVRAFRQAEGMTPHAYLMHLRVEHARRLLRVGRHPAQVAAEVGFFDQSHLHRWFNKVMGVTPSAYVKAEAPSRIWL